MGTKIIKPKFIHLFWPFLFIDVVLLFLLYGAFSSRFAWAYLKDGNETNNIIKDLLVIGVWFALSIVLAIILFRKNYYEITKTTFIHHRFGNTINYDFNRILYIDEDYSIKHKTLLFYTNDGKGHFIAFDKKGDILPLIKNSCHHLMERDEFKFKFPKAKL